MKVMRIELMDYDRELCELSDAIKRVNFKALDVKGRFIFQAFETTNK